MTRLQLLFNNRDNRQSMFPQNLQTPCFSYCLTLMATCRAWFPIELIEAKHQLFFISRKTTRNMFSIEITETMRKLLLNSHDNRRSMVTKEKKRGSSCCITFITSMTTGGLKVSSNTSKDHSPSFDQLSGQHAEHGFP